MEGSLDRGSVAASHGNFQVVSSLADGIQAGPHPVAGSIAGRVVLSPEAASVSWQTKPLVLGVGAIQSCVSGVGTGRAVGGALMTLVLEGLTHHVTIAGSVMTKGEEAFAVKLTFAGDTLDELVVIAGL